MALYSDPPQLRPFSADKPTLLVCWWITIFCLTIIVLRLIGRFIRSERLFVEDKVVALAIIPLFIRMGIVHVVLIYGTNNNDFTDVHLTSEEIHRRSIGSGLVLASRICHAATQWILKLAILEFFKRISDALSERFTQIAVRLMRLTLLATFIAIVISDLAECHPFTHYWQVLPNPGGRCRQGFAQLITMTVCNVITDLLLIFLPIPIILFSYQTAKRKVNLILLFSLSLGVVGATIYRVCRVIDGHGNQQLRSLLASVELLFATTAANALVLGSFVRDRGVKKNKFRGNSVVDSMDRSSTARPRRPTLNRHWGSDEDLVRDLGLGVRADLRDSRHLEGGDLELGAEGSAPVPRPAPVVRLDGVGNAGGNGGPLDGSRKAANAGMADMNAWQFPENRQSGTTRSGGSIHSGQSDDDALLDKDVHNASPRNNSTSAPRKVSFFDAGGLLDGEPPGNKSSNSNSSSSSSAKLSPKSASATLPATNPTTPPAPVYAASGHGQHRGSSALLQDLGGLLSPLNPRQRPKHCGKPPTDLQTVPQEPDLGPTASPSPTTQAPPPKKSAPSSNLDDVVLMDPGGLLGSRR